LGIISDIMDSPKIVGGEMESETARTYAIGSLKDCRHIPEFIGFSLSRKREVHPPIASASALRFIY